MNVDKLVEAIAQALQKAGGEAVRVWPEMVRYHWGQAIGGVFVWALALSLAIWCSRRGVAALRADPYADAPGTWLPPLVAAGALWVGVLIVLMIGGSTTVATLLAPEASLILSLMGQK